LKKDSPQNFWERKLDFILDFDCFFEYFRYRFFERKRVFDFSGYVVEKGWIREKTKFFSSFFYFLPSLGLLKSTSVGCLGSCCFLLAGPVCRILVRGELFRGFSLYVFERNRVFFYFYDYVVERLVKGKMNFFKFFIIFFTFSRLAEKHFCWLSRELLLPAGRSRLPDPKNR
jgi:hypothetical protein